MFGFKYKDILTKRCNSWYIMADLMLIDRIFEIEWKAQHLLQEYQLQGPLIQLLSEVPIINTDLLVIQGSFDPPLISHEELIDKAIKTYRKLSSNTKVAFLFLFSLSHIEKEVDLQNNSLLGYRVSMVEELLRSFHNERDITFMLGLSNVGLYYELNEAIHRKFPDHNSTYFIMGTDVFSKIFNSKYYKKPLIEVLPDIFRSNYFVAGRGETVSAQEFEAFLKSLNIPLKFNNQISFVSLSKKLRYESSTKIRQQLSDDHSAKIPSISDDVMSFLRKYHLYSKDSEIIIQEIIVQITTKLTIKEGLSQIDCLKIIHDLLKEVKYNKEFRNQVMKEFQEKNYQTLKDRIQR
ncbi:MAG: hypothetical protein ACTSRJ_04655 [Candidatus Hodarchaeales archaeon]